MLRHFALLLLVLATPTWAESVVVYNVRGYTPTTSGSKTFTGLVIVDGKVQRLLEHNERASIPDATTVDGHGAFMLPGLIDAHGHVLGLGQQRMQVDLRDARSLDEALDRIRRFAKENPSAPWIIGRGWNQVLWPGQQFPTAAQLDRALPDRPAVLARIDGHAIWVNSSALKQAGIDRNTRDPAGGRILRDESGNATGVLIDAAATLVERHVPDPSDADLTRALQLAMDELTTLGLTAVHDAGIDERQYRLYEALGRANKLPMRIYAMLADSEAARAIIARGPQPAKFSDRLHLRAVKAWVDGALGSRGAALLEDYHDQRGHRGLLLYTPAQLSELAKLTARHGWQLNVHAIGDAGNRIALDVMSNSLNAAQRLQLRPRIEHAQVVALDDLPRFAALNVIASIQPTHATSDMNMAEARVGKDRIRGAYAWRRLIDAKAKLAAGSDFPVELPNPFLGLHAAVTRQSLEGEPPGGWYGDQKLSREEALRAFTLDAAYAAHMEHVSGALEPGKWADFILIDRDYFAIPERQIADVRVIATWVGGVKVTPSTKPDT